MFSKKVFVVTLGALISVGVAGCKNPKIKKNGGRTVKASIAEFDPNADFVLDLDKYGSESPDDYAVGLAFNQAFGGMDTCVVNAKKSMGLGDAATLKGDVSVAVQLDPKTGTPSAVNATLPAKYARNSQLRDCIREVVGGVEFPKYDGTPRVAEFSCELDAGAEVEEAW